MRRRGAEPRGERRDRRRLAAKEDEASDAHLEGALDLGARGVEAPIGVPADGGEEELREFAQEWLTG